MSRPPDGSGSRRRTVELWRCRLPNRRPILTEPIEDPVTGKWHLTVGFDPAGKVREMFLDRAHKAGSPFDALAHDACILISREILQRGRPAGELLRNLSERPPSLLAQALRIAAELEKQHGKHIGEAYLRQLEEEILGPGTAEKTAEKTAPPGQGPG